MVSCTDDVLRTTDVAQQEFIGVAVQCAEDLFTQIYNHNPKVANPQPSVEPNHELLYELLDSLKRRFCYYSWVNIRPNWYSREIGHLYSFNFVVGSLMLWIPEIPLSHNSPKCLCMEFIRDQ
ncbi:unnamed protein product [Protopolystoma xenopodis]|uniref:Uncharacterized protein n=1 Tax=Protopolystoma xenopodis TaxID=117903 RepID=A0A3S5AP46_9PLAT|nr:unnamed protein product [Protopolystoma xenopodis]